MNDMNNSHIQQNSHQYFINQIKKNRNWYLGLGIGLVILGCLSIAFSLSSTLISVVYLGALLIVMGIFEGIKSVKVNQWNGFAIHFSLAVLYVIGGLFIALHPLANAVALTLLLAIFFVVAGIMRIFFAFTHTIEHKGWMILNGIVTLILGCLIFYQMPQASLWVIGTFLGIDMIFTGWNWILLAANATKLQ